MRDFKTTNEKKREHEMDLLQNIKSDETDEDRAEAASNHLKTLGISEEDMYPYGIAGEEEEYIATNELNATPELMKDLEAMGMEMYKDEIEEIHKQRSRALTTLSGGNVQMVDLTNELGLTDKETAWLKGRPMIQEVDLGDGPILCGPVGTVYREDGMLVHLGPGSADYFDANENADDFFEDDNWNEESEVIVKKKKFEQIIEDHLDESKSDDYAWNVEQEKLDQRERELKSGNITTRSSWNHPTYSREEIVEQSQKIFGKTQFIRSRLLEWFTPADIAKLHRLVFDCDLCYEDREKAVLRYMERHNIKYTKLGVGTNRLCVKMDTGYAIKFGLDVEGCIDNCREYMYAMRVPIDRVAHTYEVTTDGFIAVVEFAAELEESKFKTREVRDELTMILEELQKYFMIGDVGMTGKNYCNLGWRDGGELIITDFAYIYDVKSSNFKCGCGGTYSYSDLEFTTLECSKCHKTIPFQDIRIRISKKDQENEIGDMKKRGYVVRDTEQTLPFDPDFRYNAYERTIDKMDKAAAKRAKTHYLRDMPDPDVLLELDPKWRRNKNPLKRVQFIDDPEVRELYRLYNLDPEETSNDDRKAIDDFIDRVDRLRDAL